MMTSDINQTAFFNREPLHEERVEFLDEAQLQVRQAKRKRAKLIVLGSSLLVGSIILLLMLVDAPAPPPEVIPVEEEIVVVEPTSVQDNSLYAQIQAAKRYAQSLRVNEAEFVLPVVDTGMSID